MASTELIIKARDLDSGATSIARVEVDAPGDPDRQRIQMVEVIADVHPDARFRSFADAAATFLDRQHLIVAFYADTPAAPRRSGSKGPESMQPALFAT